MNRLILLFISLSVINCKAQNAIPKYSGTDTTYRSLSYVIYKITDQNGQAISYTKKWFARTDSVLIDTRIYKIAFMSESISVYRVAYAGEKYYSVMNFRWGVPEVYRKSKSIPDLKQSAEEYYNFLHWDGLIVLSDNLLN